MQAQPGHSPCSTEGWPKWPSVTRQTNTAGAEWDPGTNRQEEYKPGQVHTTLLAQPKEHITLVTKRARG